MGDDLSEAKRRYAIKEAQREARVAKNIAEGRTFDIKGTPLSDPKPEVSPNIQDNLNKLREEGKATNLENTIKRTGPDTLGIDPEIRNKSLLAPPIDKSELEELAANAAKPLEHTVSDVIKSPVAQQAEKGFFGKLLGAVGLGAKKSMAALPYVATAAALAPTLYSSGAKAAEGDYSGAAKEGAKGALDFFTPMAIQSDSLNSNEDEILKKAQDEQPDDVKEENRRFGKIRQVLGY